MSTQAESNQHPIDGVEAIGLRVMVPLDESLQAQRALFYARAVVEATGGEMLLVRASGVEEQAGYDKLANVARRVQDEGLSVAWKVIEGDDAVQAVLGRDILAECVLTYNGPRRSFTLSF